MVALLHSKYDAVNIVDLYLYRDIN